MSEVSKIEMILADGVRHLAIDDASELVPVALSIHARGSKRFRYGLTVCRSQISAPEKVTFPERKIRDRGTVDPRGASAVRSQRGAGWIQDRRFSRSPTGSGSLIDH